MREIKQSRGRPVLKAAIIANGYRQVEFGRAIGLNEQSISGIVTGRRKVTKAEMARISQHLRTPARILFPDEVNT
jgi:plasmid maintenance system antidote protein VapI